MNRARTSLTLIVVLLSLIACGSSSLAVVNCDRPVTTQSAGNPTVKVWVNTNSGVYHCPGTRWYGNTKSGKFMTQREAQSKGYRPAYGAVCG
jgi:nuclease S1